MEDRGEADSVEGVDSAVVVEVLAVVVAVEEWLAEDAAAEEVSVPAENASVRNAGMFYLINRVSHAFRLNARSAVER